MKINNSLIFLCIVLTSLSFYFHDLGYYAVFITIPQILIVIWFLIRNKLKKAFILHLVFTLTTIAMPFSQIIDPNGTQDILYNYSKLKILGPIGFNQIILILFFTLIYKEKSKISDILFKKLIFLFKYFLIIGFFFGVIGLIFFDYYIKHFISYSVYLLILIAYGIIYSKLNSENFSKSIFNTLLLILISSPISSVIIYLFGKTTLYGNSEILISNEAVYFSPFLIFYLSKSKLNKWILFALLCTLFIYLDGGLGGKGVIIMFFTFLMVITKLMISLRKKKILIRTLFLAPLMVISLYYFIFIQSYNYSLFLFKLESLVLIFNSLKGNDYLYLVPNSPRIRIISLINILYDNISNPFSLIFGEGFGAYFEDKFDLLHRSNLTSAFRQEEILKGKFGRPHDTISAVPLANGILGMFLILNISFKYLKRGRHNFMAYASIPFLLLAFYYNHQLGLFGLSMLYVSNSDII